MLAIAGCRDGVVAFPQRLSVRGRPEQLNTPAATALPGSAPSLVSSPLRRQNCALAAPTLPAARHPGGAAPLQLAAAMRPNSVIILVATLAALACGLPLSSASLPIIWEISPQFGLVFGTTTNCYIQTTLCGNCNPATAYASCRVW